MTTGSDWLSVYLYTGTENGATDRLLRDELSPWLAALEAAGLVQGFFFIRYWERGPHVRLRLFGRTDRLQNDIFQHFGPAIVAPPGSDTLFPSRAVRLVPYEPEIERYGGAVGLALAEKHFVASSRAVLAALVKRSIWGAEAALGASIPIHLATLRGWGFALHTAVAFTADYSRIGILQLLGEDASDEKIAAVETAFTQLLEAQRETLVPFVKTLWETLVDPRAIEDAWLAAWWQANRILAEEMAAATDQGKILVPQPWLNQPYLAPFDDRTRRLCFVGTSLMHMTNNRLGVESQDEPYLAFLLHRALAEVGK